MKLYYAIIFSIITHLILYQTLDKYASYFETNQPNDVEVILLDRDDLQVVRNPQTPNPDKLEPSDTNLLSEKNQQFKKQQKAARIGKTVNRSAPIQKKSKAQQEFDQRMKEMSQFGSQLLKQARQGDYANNQNNQQYDFDPSPQPSTVNDPLTNIPIGSFTALNTNRYLYYSFYARIEDRIRFHWVNKVRQTIESRPRIPPGEKSRNVWATELEVILDEKGEFVKADVFRSSGIEKFDIAAIDSFKEGAPIPNPPKGMIDVDGRIHLRYAFHVHWSPRYQ